MRIRGGWIAGLRELIVTHGLLTVATAALAPGAGTAFLPDGLAALDRTMGTLVADGRIPCAVVLLVRPGQGEHCFTAGFRDPDAGTPVRRDTIFCIYSITKIFTACAIMQLVERGRIGLDDPVDKFLPELANLRVWAGDEQPASETVEAATSPTIRQLLTHTAGFYYATTAEPPLAALMQNADGQVFSTPADFLRFVSSLPLHDQPGKRYRYSISFAILGLVIERVSGRSLEDHMQTELLRPLKMTDTGFVIPPEKRSRVARICRRDAAGRLFIDPKSEARVPARGTFFAGGGDLFSTADDLARLGRMLLNRGELDGVRVLSTASVEAMTNDQLGGLPIPAVDYMARDTVGFGVGVALQDSPHGLGREGSFGWTGNATTLLQIDPESNLIAIVLSQVRPGDKQVYRSFLGATYRTLPTMPSTALEAQD